MSECLDLFPKQGIKSNLMHIVHLIIISCTYYNAMTINIFTVASRISILHTCNKWVRTIQITTPFIPACRINLRIYPMFFINQRNCYSQIKFLNTHVYICFLFYSRQIRNNTLKFPT